MERTIRYFDKYELFQSKTGGTERAATTTLQSVADKVDKWYDSFWDISMKYCEGNIAEAEQFMDTSVFMYYYRIRQKASYVLWHNQQLKKKD
ncbi:MAG: hypothetical protein EOP51_35085 [Sphingobacteriales bacterium]|nr:MAG: hypothetical protein EOP51_35085 [Sphingobacteriales bacterium]